MFLFFCTVQHFLTIVFTRLKLFLCCHIFNQLPEIGNWIFRNWKVNLKIPLNQHHLSIIQTFKIKFQQATLRPRLWGTVNHKSGHIITILSHKLPFVSLTFSLINIQNVTRKTREKRKKILRLMICHFPSFQKSDWLLKKWLHPSEKTFLTSVKLMQLMLKMWSFPGCSWKIWHILTHLPHSRFSFIAAHKAHISEVSVSHEYYLEHQRKLQSQFTMNWRTTVYTMYLKACVFCDRFMTFATSLKL